MTAATGNNPTESLVTLSDPYSPAAEAYRNLRTNLQFSSLDKKLQTFLITSARPDENKSETLANLAITFAQAGHSVVLVDCDFRRPALHSLFGVRLEPGLTNVILDAGGLSGKNNANLKFPFVETGVAGLKLLTAGPQPPNPAEILGSNLMEEIIGNLRETADYIFFDAPPVLAVTDAVLLATRVDGVLLSLKANKTRRDDAREAKEQLARVRANILGVVLNNVKQGSTRFRY